MASFKFIGICVSSQTLEIASSPYVQTYRVANDAGGIEDLVSHASGWAPTLVVLEAAGGDELKVAYALQASGLAVAVFEPRVVARAMGRLVKNNVVDARTLAIFARMLHQHAKHRRYLMPPADPELQQLQALLLRRRQLMQMLNSERKRLRLAHAAARPSIERVIVFLTQEMDVSAQR